jgi:hypothetical protein
MKISTIVETKKETQFIRWFDDLTNADVAIAGGKIPLLVNLLELCVRRASMFLMASQ